MLAVAPLITGVPQMSSETTPHPVASSVRQVGFAKSTVASMRAVQGGTGSTLSTPGEPDPISRARAGAVTAVQDVAGEVTVVGVTWPKGAVSAGDQFQIRTLTGQTWSQWQTLDSDTDGPDAKEAATAATVAAGGTSPYVITDASKFEVRSLTTDPSAPTAATVQVVDPGTSEADSNQLAAAPGAAAAATARPTIYPRTAWGANETLRRINNPILYGRVKVGFVHHTASQNNYSSGQVPAMIRGIYAYHVRGKGWDDIGYNFLVDRFGRTWEGRYGGMTRALVGAQVEGYNDVSTGVAAIGNFAGAGVPARVTAAIQRVLAWKLSLAGVPATGRVVANGRSFQRISGHRDGFQTTCPGRYLYATLPQIRAGVAALMVGHKLPPAPKPVVIKPSPAATRYTPYKSKVLKQGARGSAVAVLQRALKIKVDGAYGPGTRAAVMTFQTRQRLTRDGVVGRQVWNRLERRDYPLIAYRRVTLRQGSKGAAVKVLQRALRLPADGRFGLRTTASVKAVQLKAKLPRTGVVSGWTWVAIERRMPR